jgi:hypothetical protein
LYAYNNILNWAQEAHTKGYTFPVTAPKYNSFMPDLAKRFEFDHLSHTLATIEKTGVGTLLFPTFDFEAMFASLLDDTHPSHLSSRRKNLLRSTLVAGTPDLC